MLWTRENVRDIAEARSRKQRRDERDKYIRAFNRLEKAVTNHISQRCIDSDDLEHVHKSVMRDLREGGDAA